MKQLAAVIAAILLLSSCSPQCYVQEVVCYKSYENGYVQYDFVPTYDSAAIRYYEDNRMFYYEVNVQDHSITVPKWDTVWVRQINHK